MAENFSYYVAILALIIIGVIAAKKIVSCLIKSIVILILAAATAYIYFEYLQ